MRIGYAMANSTVLSVEHESARITSPPTLPIASNALSMADEIRFSSFNALIMIDTPHGTVGTLLEKFSGFMAYRPACVMLA